MKHILLIVAMVLIGTGAWAGEGDIGFDDYITLAEPSESIALFMFHMDDDGTYQRMRDPGIIDLLERCREFVRNGDENYLRGIYDANITYTLEARYPHRTLKDDALESLEKAKADKERLDRETQLRKDIDAALKVLKP